MSTTAPQAIKPAYIVLAGLGAGNLLLVTIAVVVLCSYPIRDGDHHINNGGISASATNADDGRGSSSKKREKKSKTVKTQNMNDTVAAGDVEMNHTEATSVHHQNYDDGQMVETNPYYEHGGAQEEQRSDHVNDVYENQAELDSVAKHHEKDSHAF